MTPAGKGALSVLFLVTPALAAHAQEPRQRLGRFKLGPLYVTPKLELKNAGVDTNVLNTPVGVPDTQVVLSPALAGVLPVGRRLTLQGDGYLDLNYFRRSGDARSTDFGGKGGFELRLGLLALFGSGGGLQARQRFSTDLDERILRQEKFGEAGVRVQLTRRLALTGIAGSRIHTFEPYLIGTYDIKSNFDREAVTASAQLRYALTRRTTLVATTDAVEDRFKAVPDVSSRVVRSFRYLGGFEFGEKAVLNGKLLVGLREFPVASTRGAPNYRGAALSVATMVPLPLGARALVQADRDVYFSAFRARDERLRNTYVSTRVSAQPEFSLPLGLLARGGLGYDHAKHLLPYPIGNRLVERVDRYYHAGGVLLRQFGDSLRIGGNLTWHQRRSSIEGQSYRGLRYGVTAEVVP